MEIKMKV